MSVTRLAPSPTGALHLGNARTFLLNWLMARQRGWRILLRVEDLDGPRVKRGADQQAIDDLQWLGLDWDDGPIYQSSRTRFYQDATERLIEAGLAYPCVCSRREALLAASAPHPEDGSSVYPGTCRGRFRSVDDARRTCGREPVIRFRASDGSVEFEDAFRGHVRFSNLAQQLGDFVIRKADGTAAYQLAVVVDDAGMGVTDVVRGDDLLDSTPRQMMLYRALQMEQRIPRYTHLPLVVGPDGRRLAKRHGDTRLAHYRAGGASAGRVRALLGRWSGIACADDEVSLAYLLERFDLQMLLCRPIVMTAQDDAWLMGRV